MLPRLHLVTDDVVLAASGFAVRAGALMEALGPALALHLRARERTTASLHALAAGLAPAALRTGALLVLNDRVDVALAVRAGAHLHAASIPVADARRLLHHAPLGYSAHGVEEAALAASQGADYVFLGTIYASPSHPGRAAAGIGLVADAAAVVGVPVLAIGGVTTERVRPLLAAGAFGVAVISGVWGAADPLAAARAYEGELERSAG